MGLKKPLARSTSMASLRGPSCRFLYHRLEIIISLWRRSASARTRYQFWGEKLLSEIRVVDESRRQNWPSVTLSLVLSQRQRAFDRGGRGQWSHLFLNTLCIFLSLSFLSVALSILTLPPLSFLSPSSHPHTSRGESIWWPRLLVFFVVVVFFPLCCPSHESAGPNLSMCACVCVFLFFIIVCVSCCVSVRMCVCERVCNQFRPGCANMGSVSLLACY